GTSESKITGLLSTASAAVAAMKQKKTNRNNRNGQDGESCPFFILEKPERGENMKEAEDALNDYLHFLRVERQLADNTIGSYKRDLLGYIRHLEKVELPGSLDNVSRPDIL